MRRRTVYRFIVRSVPNPFMEASTAPTRTSTRRCAARRSPRSRRWRCWNDLFMVRQSQRIRPPARGDSPTTRDAQIDAAYRLALGRAPRADERDALAAYAAKHGLANACRLLFNTNEFVFVD